MSDQAPALREPWTTLPRQAEAATFGIWLFLGSEVLFFGAFFMAYAFLRVLHPEAFALASRHTALVYGTANTALLLTSGLSMVLAARAAAIKHRPMTVSCLLLTAALGVAFVAVKGLEYAKDLREGLWPGPHFALPPAAALFFSFYWIITVIHAIHLSIGIVLVGRLALLAARGTLPLRSPQVEVTALYWALVDIVWIMLYPMLYLGGRAP